MNPPFLVLKKKNYESFINLKFVIFNLFADSSPTYQGNTTWA